MNNYEQLSLDKEREDIKKKQMVILELKKIQVQ